MQDFKCPSCGKSIQLEDSSCPGCGRSIKRTMGKPLTLQFIVESKDMGSFTGFINELSEYIGRNYDINDFSYSMSDVIDDEGRNTGFVRVLMNITEDSNLLEFIGDWIDNKLKDLNLYKNSEVYKKKNKAHTEKRACPNCGGTGKVTEEQRKVKCTCQNGYIYTRNLCPSCKGKGSSMLGLLKCRSCNGAGVIVGKRKCLSCGGSGYSKPGGFAQVSCKTCGGKGYLDS